MRKITVKDFDAVYSIMEESFPVAEYRSYEKQKALLSKEEYSVYVNKEGEINAFLSVYELSCVTFIEHFAVSFGCRNKGIGSRILKETVKTAKNIVCLEVEIPNGETEKRRIAFYERNGFYLNPYPYVQPPIEEGKEEVDLLIMSYGRPLEKEEFFEIKNTVYEKVYGIKKDIN